MVKKRKMFSRPIESESTEDNTNPPVDCSMVKRLEVDDLDPYRIEVEGDTLFVGQKIFRGAKINQETGATYFEEGHILYDFFSHNIPAEEKQ